MLFTALSAMVRKDLALFFADRRALVMAFAAPIAIASFFGSIFPGGASPQSAPTRIATSGVRMRNRNCGGVIRSRLAALAKNGKTRSTGWAIRISSRKRCVCIPSH